MIAVGQEAVVARLGTVLDSVRGAAQVEITIGDYQLDDVMGALVHKMSGDVVRLTDKE